MQTKHYGLFGAAGLMMLALITPAGAQDVFGAGRSPEQIFASDCSSCHKTPQGLAKRGGMFGLSSFLREHYTVSSQAASALARYLESVGDAPAAAPPRQPRRAAPAKPADKKPAETKPAESKPAEAKPESKPDAKPEAKPDAPKLPE